MNNVYYLQIDIDDSDISLLKKVDSILKIEHNTSNWWQYVIEQKKQIN